MWSALLSEKCGPGIQERQPQTAAVGAVLDQDGEEMVIHKLVTEILSGHPWHSVLASCLFGKSLSYDHRLGMAPLAYKIHQLRLMGIFNSWGSGALWVWLTISSTLGNRLCNH